jgi:two-component system, LuxR family, response regulator FixJ
MTAPAGRVFVVDDDEAVRKSLKFVLELEGLDVQLFDDGDAFLRARVTPADGCMLIDYIMPSMNGVELMGEMKTRSIDMPCLLMTVRPSDELRLRALDVGFLDVLEKPLDDGTLVDTIRSALASAH